MRRRAVRWLALAGAAAALVAIAAAAAHARPGGGHTYSGGSSGGGGGGGSGGGSALFELLFILIFQHPQIGLPLTAIIIFLYVMVQRSKKDLPNWDSAEPVTRTPPPDLERIRALDPDFSIVLFEDFVFRLYAQAQRARIAPQEMAKLAPYVSEQTRTALLDRQPQGRLISNVVIGALQIESVDVPSDPADEQGQPNYVSVNIGFESNYTADMGGSFETYYARDSWQLVRAATTRSRPPSATREFNCPNCGAPFESSDDQTCAYCGEIVANGRFDWLVNGARLRGQDKVPPVITGTVAERGTDLPTIVHPGVDRRWRELLQDDPALTQESLRARLTLIYDQLNTAWTNLDLSAARPYVSDGLYDYLTYWIDAYRTQGLRNVLEGMRLYHWTYARIVRDRWFDSLTVRIWGSGRDYTVDAGSGRVVGGHKGRDRDYTEYWTIIRAAGARGAARSDKQCPNCGAELKINMAGTCEYCHTHVTAGEFDWVLSKIEQDEAYRG